MAKQVPLCWLILISLILLALLGLQVTDKILEYRKGRETALSQEKEPNESTIQLDIDDLRAREASPDPQSHAGLRSTSVPSPVAVNLSDFKIGLASLHQLRAGRMKRFLNGRFRRAGGTDMSSTTDDSTGASTDTNTNIPIGEVLNIPVPPKPTCNPIVPPGQRPPPGFDPNLPPCKSPTTAVPDSVPTIYEGSLKYGDPNCWSNDQINEEGMKGVEDYPPAPGNKNAGVQKKTAVLDKNVCNWSKHRLQCMYIGEVGNAAEDSKCGCGHPFPLHVGGTCYLEYNSSIDCTGPEIPLPDRPFAEDQNPTKLDNACAPDAKCSESPAWSGKQCVKVESSGTRLQFKPIMVGSGCILMFLLRIKIYL